MNRELIAAFVETITAERGAAANTVAAVKIKCLVIALSIVCSAVSG